MKWAGPWENVSCHMRTTKTQISLRSLISAFVVRCLDSIISLRFLIWNFKTLASFCDCKDRFESILVAHPRRHVSHDEAQMHYVIIEFYLHISMILFFHSSVMSLVVSILLFVNKRMTMTVHYQLSRSSLNFVWVFVIPRWGSDSI